MFKCKFSYDIDIYYQRFGIQKQDTNSEVGF